MFNNMSLRIYWDFSETATALEYNTIKTRTVIRIVMFSIYQHILIIKTWMLKQDPRDSMNVICDKNISSHITPPTYFRQKAL